MNKLLILKAFNFSVVINIKKKLHVQNIICAYVGRTYLSKTAIHFNYI